MVSKLGSLLRSRFFGPSRNVTLGERCVMAQKTAAKETKNLVVFAIHTSLICLCTRAISEKVTLRDSH